MKHLIAQHVQAIKHDGQDSRRILVLHCRFYRLLISGQSPLPIVKAWRSVMMPPEGSKNILVRRQKLDFVCEAMLYASKDLQCGNLGVSIKDRIDVLDDVGTNFKKVALVLDWNKGTFRAVVLRYLQWLD